MMATFPRSGVLVLGANTIHTLVPATLTSQIESLLDNHRINDAFTLAEQQRKKELERKIAALQSELSQFPGDDVAVSKAKSPKRPRVEPKLLAPDTPSPRA